MFDSLLPYGLWSTRLLCPWDSPGKNPGVGCHAPLQGISAIQGSNQHLCVSYNGRQILYCKCHLIRVRVKYGFREIILKIYVIYAQCFGAVCGYCWVNVIANILQTAPKQALDHLCFTNGFSG